MITCLSICVCSWEILPCHITTAIRQQYSEVLTLSCESSATTRRCCPAAPATMWKVDGIRRWRWTTKCLYSWRGSVVSPWATVTRAFSTSRNIRWACTHVKWSRCRISTRLLPAVRVSVSEAAWIRQPTTTQPSSFLDAASMQITVALSTGRSPTIWMTGGERCPNVAPVYFTILRRMLLFRPTPFVDSVSARSGLRMIFATVRGIRTPIFIPVQTLSVSAVGQITPFGFTQWIAGRCMGQRFFRVCLEKSLVLRFRPMRLTESRDILPLQL